MSVILTFLENIYNINKILIHLKNVMNKIYFLYTEQSDFWRVNVKVLTMY